MFEPFEAEGVRGFLHSAHDEKRDGLVLTHGAGSNAKAPLLVRVADALAATGLTVLRCDLPFRQQRPSGPPHPSGAARDREGLRQAAGALRGIVSGRIFLGGVSYGGRQASMLAAEDSSVAAGLLLLSYPLHAPGKPGDLRTAHFPKLQVPALFVHGSRDPFGSVDEMRAALPLIPARTDLIIIEGSGHELRGLNAAAIEGVRQSALQLWGA